MTKIVDPNILLLYSGINLGIQYSNQRFALGDEGVSGMDEFKNSPPRTNNPIATISTTQHRSSPDLTIRGRSLLGRSTYRFIAVYVKTKSARNRSDLPACNSTCCQRVALLSCVFLIGRAIFVQANYLRKDCSPNDLTTSQQYLQFGLLNHENRALISMEIVQWLH